VALAGRGHIVVWEGASLWMLDAAQERPEVRPHAHHAIQITFQLKGSFEISAPGESVSAPIVAVASDTRHAFRASGAGAFLFIEPESPAGRALTQELFALHPIVALDSMQARSWLERLRDCYRDGGSEVELLTLGRTIVGDMPQAMGSLLPDPRVRRMIAYATANLQERLTLSAAAAHVNLSQSRARHLFASHAGLPFKTYVLWRRIERAVHLYAAGKSLTEATHLAGFADSAHFSRTFKRTFGLPASALRLGQRQP
jgi:AraC-like DNA-binding protein